MTAGSTPRKTKKTPASAGPAATPRFKGRVKAGVEILSRKNKSTTQGAYTDFDTANRFRYYSQLATCTPHASISLNKLGFSLVKNARFTGKNRIVKNFEAWSRRTHFLDALQTIGRLIPRDGIYIAEPMGKDPEKMWMKPLLMPYVTILGEGLKPGDQITDIMQPPISNIVVNEVLNSGDKQKHTYKPEELVLGTFGAWDYKQPDINGRDTYGIYGASFMEPLAITIQNYLGLDQGFISFVRKYGMGRYLFDFELLEKLVADGTLTYDEAQDAIDEFNEKHAYLKENEDISALGLKVDAIDAKGSLDIQNFRDSLVSEIQIGLLQSPLVMGKASGTTYASAYMAEEDRMLVLEGLQRTIEDIANDIINRRLALMNQPEDSIQIEFDKLSRVQLTASECQEMYNTGVISKYQFQRWAGFADEEDETTGTE